MDISMWDYLTFRNVILAIFCLPLVTMLLTIAFLGLIPKGAKTGISLFGYFGAIASSVVVIELVSIEPSAALSISNIKSRK